MTSPQHPHQHIEMVPIAQIHVVNPRGRNRRIHGEIIENIRAVGLKRPITVSRRAMPDGSLRYELVCGQGRLEAFQAMNQREIPAFITDASQEDCLLMSLVENIARRQHRPIDLMREIGSLRERGQSDAQIAERIGVTASWVNMIVGLLERGEEKLLSAVETGVMPLSMAASIARSSEAEIQDLLTEAYEQGLRGRKLGVLRRLLEVRARRDKLVRTNPLGGGKHKKRTLTPTDLRRMYESEAEKQRLLVKKASVTHDRLVFATEALKELMGIAEFSKLLRGEQLDSMPKLLKDRIAGGLA